MKILNLKYKYLTKYNFNANYNLFLKSNAYRKFKLTININRIHALATFHLQYLYSFVIEKFVTGMKYNYGT